MAVIPTRYEPDRLRALIPFLDDATVLILDNGHEPPLDLPGRVVDSRGLGIYQMWNRGWASARHEGFDAIALLNDDITILPGTIGCLALALGSDPTLGVVSPDKYVSLADGLPDRMELDIMRDPERERTLEGFAFLSRLSMFPYPPFDPSYHWWFGDNAFDEKVRQAGYGVARVLGLPIEHVSDSEANDWARRPELRKLAQQDLARWDALHRVKVPR